MTRFFMVALLLCSGTAGAAAKFELLDRVVARQLGADWNMARLSELRNLEAEMFHRNEEEGLQTTSFLKMTLPNELFRLDTRQNGALVSAELLGNGRLFYTPEYGTVPLPKRHAALLHDESRRGAMGLVLGLHKAKKISLLGKQRWIDDPRLVLEGEALRILWPEGDQSLRWDYLLAEDGQILAERLSEDTETIVLHGPRRPSEPDGMNTYIELNPDASMRYEERQRGTVRLRANLDFPKRHFEVLP